MARPKKYESHVQPKLLLIEAWARDGLTLEQIAHNLDIAPSTLNEYKKDEEKYPELSVALKRSREEADIVIENELYEKAKGKMVTLQKAKVLQDGTVIEYNEQSYIPGDTTAQIFWLKNRRSNVWRDKPDAEERYKKLIALLGKLNLSPEEIDELVNSL